MTDSEASDDDFDYDPSVLAMKVLVTGLSYEEAVRVMVEHYPPETSSMMVESLDRHLTEKERLYRFKPWTRSYDRAFVFLGSSQNESAAAAILLALVVVVVAPIVGLAAIGFLAASCIALEVAVVLAVGFTLIVWRRRSLSLRYSDSFWPPR